MASTLGSINPFRYRSYYYDSDLALYYLQSRYYDPNTGRFINADSQLNESDGVLGYNLYAYCLNNPVNLSDPTGKVALVDDAICVVIIAMIAVVAVEATYEATNYYSSTGTGTLTTFPDALTLPNVTDVDLTKYKQKTITFDMPTTTTKTKTIDVVIAKTKTTTSPSPGLYYQCELTYPGVDVYMMARVSFSTAILLVLSGDSIYCSGSQAAKALCIAASGGFEDGCNERAVINGENPYHYHLKNRITPAHIIFGNQAVHYVVY